MGEAFEDVIREYIDFVNAQVGVYMDALAGFAGNRARVERQIHRVQRKAGEHIDDTGQQVTVWASYEDPSKPEVILHRIIRASEYIAANSESGSNEQQHSQAVLIFLFTYWEDAIRPRLAASKGVEPQDIRSDIMGDLRVLRNVILHAKGIMRPDKLKELKKLRDMFVADQTVSISYDGMHHIFVLIKQDLAQMMFDWLGVTNAPFKPGELTDVAIQKNRTI